MFAQPCPVYPCKCVRCSSPDGIEPGVHYARRGAVKTVARKGWLSAVVLAAVTFSGVASAETLVNGKVVRTTADKIVAERQLVCTYAKGSTRVETDSKGRTVVIMGKVCTEVSR